MQLVHPDFYYLTCGKKKKKRKIKRKTFKTNFSVLKI